MLIGTEYSMSPAASTFIDRIGDQCLTFFGRNVNEVAVAIQLGSHFKNNQTEAMSRKRAIE